MNEEALKVLYSLAKKDGYQKDFKDFIKLMSSNEKAVDQMYGLARSDGYKKELPDFQILVGLKKKRRIRTYWRGRWSRLPKGG